MKTTGEKRAVETHSVGLEFQFRWQISHLSVFPAFASSLIGGNDKRTFLKGIHRED
jgi:hypothetical protein